MVPNVPFWLSQANTEFGGGGVTSTILSKAGIPAPQWVSNLAGKSASTHVLTPRVQVQGQGELVGFRGPTDVYGYPQTTFGSISPASFIGTITSTVSTTNGVDTISMAALGNYPSSNMEITIHGLGKGTGQVLKGGTANFSVMVTIPGAFNYLKAEALAGRTVGISFRVV